MRQAIQRPATAVRFEAFAVLLMASAWGWNGGNFSQPDSSIGFQVFITAVHYLPCALVIGFGVTLIANPAAAWARIALSVVAGVGVVALAVIVAMGIGNPDPNSFGPHNFADYVPVFLIATGIAAWFGSQWMRAKNRR